MSDNLGIYIHIPFCRSKCPYCDFFSMRADSEEYEKYTDEVINSIRSWSLKVQKTVDTIYFGGGTPSVLKAEKISRIISSVKNSFNCSDSLEITMEANPKSAIEFDFNEAKRSGLNRVSLGVQSANENELKPLGRVHRQKDVIEEVSRIKSSGINNISVDLMLGIPNQTADSLKNSIDYCLSLGLKHISVYILKLEENTYFYKNRAKLNLPDDEAVAELYLFAVDYLEKNGFEQYEISNFCRNGYESIHNLKYWNLDDYLGIGPAAHSYLNGKRFYYDRSIDDFINNNIINDGEGGSPSEYIMLQLRLKKGLDIKEYKEVFGNIPDKDFFEKVKYYSKSGFMNFNQDNISFTKKGFLLSNTILADLI